MLEGRSDWQTLDYAARTVGVLGCSISLVCSLVPQRLVVENGDNLSSGKLMIASCSSDGLRKKQNVKRRCWLSPVLRCVVFGCEIQKPCFTILSGDTLPLAPGALEYPLGGYCGGRDLRHAICRLNPAAVREIDTD
jgi:hypothetical protein